jgi:hypothetical protein
MTIVGCVVDRIKDQERVPHIGKRPDACLIREVSRQRKLLKQHRQRFDSLYDGRRGGAVAFVDSDYVRGYMSAFAQRECEAVSFFSLAPLLVVVRGRRAG